jgi:molybdenum-dependent DNA-binding transcriptional regulator ModE
MEFDPELWLRIKDKRISAHQIRVLAELNLTHSQTQAALNLGISVPVLHRHLKSLVNKLNTELVITTPNGTWLTAEGRLVLKIYNRYQEMFKGDERIILCCSPITQELLIQAVSTFEKGGKQFHISINDDSQNLKALYLGRADLVIFDDPNYAIEFEGFKEDKILTIDLFKDTLIHHKKGAKYIRYKFGAQRLGFRYLDAKEEKYKVLYESSSLSHLLNSKYSFFINESLAIRKNIKILSESDTNMFKHPIMAVSINPTDEIKEIVDEIKELAEE